MVRLESYRSTPGAHRFKHPRRTRSLMRGARMRDKADQVGSGRVWRIGCGWLAVLLFAVSGYYAWVIWYASYQHENRVEDAQLKLTRLTRDIVRVSDTGVAATTELTFLSEAGVDLGYLDANKNYSYTSKDIVIWDIQVDESGTLQQVTLLARGILHSDAYPFIWSTWDRSGQISFRVEARNGYPESPDSPTGIKWDENGRMVR